MLGDHEEFRVILAFGVSALPHAIAAPRVCANRSGTSSVSANNLSTSAPPIRGYAPMAGLKYRWKISPKSRTVARSSRFPGFRRTPPLCARNRQLSTSSARTAASLMPMSFVAASRVSISPSGAGTRAGARHARKLP